MAGDALTFQAGQEGLGIGEHSFSLGDSRGGNVMGRASLVLQLGEERRNEAGEWVKSCTQLVNVGLSLLTFSWQAPRAIWEDISQNILCQLPGCSHSPPLLEQQGWGSPFM